MKKKKDHDDREEDAGKSKERQVQDYVREQLKQGFSAEAIRTVLLRASYPEHEIDSAIADALKPEVGIHEKGHVTLHGFGPELGEEAKENKEEEVGEKKSEEKEEETRIIHEAKHEEEAPAAEKPAEKIEETKKAMHKEKPGMFRPAPTIESEVRTSHEEKEEKPREKDLKAKIGLGRMALMFLISLVITGVLPVIMLFFGPMAVYANYVWTLILAAISGIICIFMIKKYTASPKTLVSKSAVISALLAIVISVGIQALNTAKDRITNTLLESIVQVPDPLTTAALIYVSFNIPFIIETFKEKDRKIAYFIYYLIGLILSLAAAFSAKYLMGSII
ncbi:hypothetical protein GF351_06380 [Candidatus Woesearchaeota archaeon]|nr:hypothetical protein [Candidatus Woesearchaeota archaeon]